MRAVVMTPRGLPPGARLPLLIALHGLGESLRGVASGAWGWSRDYELGASERALRTSPLSRDAFLGFVTESRFRRLRADLAARPYDGLVVVAPYTPNVMDDPARADAFSRWVVSTLLPRARRELPVLSGRAHTGVDGVSLGGLLALEVGLSQPDEFGVVGALQPAVRGRVERVLARRRAGAPAQRIRLLTTSRDFLRPDVFALHRAMTARHIAHDFVDVSGPHDYPFNRGSGGIEMLLFHDRALRGLRPE